MPNLGKVILTHLSLVKLSSGSSEMMGSVSRYDLVMYNVMMPDGGTYYCKARQGDELLLLATYTVSVSKGRLVGYTQQQYLSLVGGVYPAAVFVTCCWGIPSSSICH